MCSRQQYFRDQPTRKFPLRADRSPTAPLRANCSTCHWNCHIGHLMGSSSRQCSWLIFEFWRRPSTNARATSSPYACCASAYGWIYRSARTLSPRASDYPFASSKGPCSQEDRKLNSDIDYTWTYMIEAINMADINAMIMPPVRRSLCSVLLPLPSSTAASDSAKTSSENSSLKSKAKLTNKLIHLIKSIQSKTYRKWRRQRWRTDSSFVARWRCRIGQNCLFQCNCWPMDSDGRICRRKHYTSCSDGNEVSLSPRSRGTDYSPPSCLTVWWSLALYLSWLCPGCLTIRLCRRRRTRRTKSDLRTAASQAWPSEGLSKRSSAEGQMLGPWAGNSRWAWTATFAKA